MKLQEMIDNFNKGLHEPVDTWNDRVYSEKIIQDLNLNSRTVYNFNRTIIDGIEAYYLTKDKSCEGDDIGVILVLYKYKPVMISIPYGKRNRFVDTKWISSYAKAYVENDIMESYNDIMYVDLEAEVDGIAVKGWWGDTQ